MANFGIFRGFSDKLFEGELPTKLGSAYDDDSILFFNRVIEAGGSLSETEKFSINQLVITLKFYNLWLKLKAIYPMVGSSSTSCRQNLKSSSFTATFTSGWTFASTGVTPNGTSAYMDTSLIPFNVLNQDSQSYFIYSRTNVTNREGWDMGAYTTNALKTNISFSWNDSKSYGVVNQNTNLISNQTNTLGLFGINRTANNLTKLYKNNINIASSSAVSVGNVDKSIYLAFVNNEPYLRYTNREYAFASIGEGLTDTETSNLYTAVQAFQTTLSRNV